MYGSMFVYLSMVLVLNLMFDYSSMINFIFHSIYSLSAPYEAKYITVRKFYQFLSFHCFCFSAKQLEVLKFISLLSCSSSEENRLLFQCFWFLSFKLLNLLYYLVQNSISSVVLRNYNLG